MVCFIVKVPDKSLKRTKTDWMSELVHKPMVFFLHDYVSASFFLIIYAWKMLHGPLCAVRVTGVSLFLY